MLRTALRTTRLKPVYTTRVFTRFNSDRSKFYIDRLQQKAEQEGLKNVDELKQKYADTIKDHKKSANKENPFKFAEEEPSGPKDRGKRSDDIPPIDEHKTLNHYVDLPKLSMHDAKEIGLLWKARFAEKERSLSGVIDHDTYRRIFRNARWNPRFVLPVPHEGQGAELHYLQWAVPGPYTLHCMITSLAEFKLHHDYARPHTTLAIHSELLAEKEIALMNGDVEKDANVTQAQGAFLVANLQRFYGANENSLPGKRKLELLQAFTRNSPDFTAAALIEEVETLD